MKFKETNLLIVLYLLKVSVKWPSEKYPRERELNDDLVALGIALVRGTYTQMATAIFKIKPLKQSIIQCLLKELSRESANLTSRKNPSILRKTLIDDMRNFKLENICKQLSTRAPLLYSTLLTTAIFLSKRNKFAPLPTPGAMLFWPNSSSVHFFCYRKQHCKRGGGKRSFNLRR